MSLETLRTLIGQKDRAEFNEALPDLVRLTMGAEIADPHPIAKLARRAHCSLESIAAFCADPYVTDLDAPRVLAAATTTTFKDSLGTAMNDAAKARSNSLLDDLMKITHPVRLNDFREGTLTNTDVGALDDDPEGAGIKQIVVSSDGEPIQAAKSVRNLVISREMMLADDFGAIESIFGAIYAAVSRRVARDLVDTLVGNPNLKDGAAWFGASNTATGPGLSVGTVSEANDLLANQPTLVDDADRLGVNGRYLVVPASQYAEALTLLAAMTLTAPPIEVVSLPWLAGDAYWYLLPDPNDAPAVALGSLSDSLVTINSLPKEALRGQDGLPYRVSTAHAIAPMSRAIIRVPLV